MLLQNHLPHQKDVGETRNLTVMGQLMVDLLEDGKRNRYLLPTGPCYWSMVLTVVFSYYTGCGGSSMRVVMFFTDRTEVAALV